MHSLGEEARTLTIVYGLLNHLQKPLLDTTGPLIAAYRLGFSQGDLTFAGKAITLHCTARLLAGCNLEHLVTDAFRFCHQLKAYNQMMMWYTMVNMQRSCLEMTGRSDEIVQLTGKVLDDAAFEEFLRLGKAEMVEFLFLINCLLFRYYLGDMASALEYGERCWKSKASNGVMVFSVMCIYVSALTALEHWKKAFGRKRFRYWHIFRKNHRELQSWVTKGNPNTRHLVYLLDAAYLSTRKGRDHEVQPMFDKSIAVARRAGFVHEAALANELAGVYFLNKLDTDWASVYLQRAKAMYTDWGASAKVEQMDAKYGFLVKIGDSSSQPSHSLAGRSRGDVVDMVEKTRNRTSSFIET